MVTETPNEGPPSASDRPTGSTPTKRTQALSRDEQISWLQLIRSKNVGPGTFFRLLRHFKTATKAIEGIPDLAKRGGHAGRLRIASKQSAEQELDTIDNIEASVISWGESDYPPLLRHIHDPPPLLIVKGRTDLLRKRSIGVVGARNASANGRRFAEKIAGDLGSGGLLVASGLARGVDTSAHWGAITTGTAAVLGGGIDVVYPRENQDLYERIAADGVLMTEAPPGTRPQARHFPRRNRIISGMARGVVVVEASPRSGSLITARLALEQGREVFSVPGAAMDPRARGTNELIRQGATLTENAEDVFAVLNQQNRLTTDISPDELPGTNGTLTDVDDHDTARKLITENLSPAPTTVDELHRLCQFSPAAVSTVLLELELAGRLERHPGNKVSIILDP